MKSIGCGTVDRCKMYGVCSVRLLLQKHSSYRLQFDTCSTLGVSVKMDCLDKVYRSPSLI